MLRGYEEDSDDEDKVIYGEADEHSQAAFIQDETAVKIDWKSSFDSIAGYRQLKDKVSARPLHIGLLVLTRERAV